MSYWESGGKSDEWYTPKYVFDALGCTFDLDVANGAVSGANVPCLERIGADSLMAPWQGLVWMNPPFGGRNGIVPWLDKFFAHGNGIALTPDRTSTDWWQDAALRSDAILFFRAKVKFERPDGSIGASPSTGTTLFACGPVAVTALVRSRLGVVFKNE